MNRMTHMMAAGSLIAMAAAKDAGHAPKTTKAKPDAPAPEAAPSQAAVDAALAAPLPGDPEAPAVHTKETAGDGKVFVACKLPHGYDLGGGVVLKGSNDEHAKRAGGYGITGDVDASFMEAWAKQHPGNVAIARKLLFWGTNAADVVAQAREQAGEATGFEQLDRSRMPAGLEEDPDTKARRERGES